MEHIQSLLPENLEGSTIELMLTGDTGYTLPWAMWADEDRKMWMNPKYPISKTPTGTTQMAIERTEDGVNVFLSTLPKGYKYTPSESSWPKELPVRLVEGTPH